VTSRLRRELPGRVRDGWRHVYVEVGLRPSSRCESSASASRSRGRRRFAPGCGSSACRSLTGDVARHRDGVSNTVRHRCVSARAKRGTWTQEASGRATPREPGHDADTRPVQGRGSRRRETDAPASGASVSPGKPFRLAAGRTTTTSRRSQKRRSTTYRRDAEQRARRVAGAWAIQAELRDGFPLSVACFVASFDRAQCCVFLPRIAPVFRAPDTRRCESYCVFNIRCGTYLQPVTGAEA
jgi:hypothetical protein